MSNYSDKSDGDGNLSSTNSTFNTSTHNASLTIDQSYSRLANTSAHSNTNRSRSRSPVSSKSRSRSRSRSEISYSRSLSPNLTSNSTGRLNDSYRRARDHSPRYHANSNGPKRRERSLSTDRYSAPKRRSRSPLNQRYQVASSIPRPPPPPVSQHHIPSSRARVSSRHTPPEYSSRNHLSHTNHNSDFIDRFNPPANEILAIFGLNKRVNEQDLLDLYKDYGCKECKIIIDKHTGCPKGYGFVYFGRVKDAIVAKKETDGRLLLNKPIRVDFSIGERDFGQSNHNQHHHAPPPPPQSYSASSKANYLDNRSSKYTYSSSSSSSSTSHPDYYRRDQRAPIISRELIARDYRDRRERSPPPPSAPRHLKRYASQPMSPPAPPPPPRQSAVQRFNQQNGYYSSSSSITSSNSKDDRRRLAPGRAYPRTPSPPVSRSRSRSLDRGGHRRYNNDINSDYYNNARSNGVSMSRYNENMISQSNRRRLV